MIRVVRFAVAIAPVALVMIAVTAAAGASGSQPAGHLRISAPPKLVGRWTQVISCPELVHALRKAGLGALATTAWTGETSSTGESSYAPGSPSPTRSQPCRGAIPRRHSHFFTESGAFGSLDWTGHPVDDGTYRIIDSHSMRIGSVTFRYSISGGNKLSLAPVITAAMRRKALADPTKFSDAGWAVSVAFAGHAWKRVKCAGWC
jgi:hypothetical protein